MKSILIFLPHWFNKAESGYICGEIIYDANTKIKKFYALGIMHKHAEVIKSSNNIIGYYSGTDNFVMPVDKRYPDWINISYPTKTLIDTHHDYYVKNIVINNKNILTLSHVVLVIYDQRALQESELFVNKVTSGNHFSELKSIIESKSMESTKQKDIKYCIANQNLLLHCMFFCFYPIIFLSNVIEKMMGLLKYTSLGLRINTWLQNAKWVIANLCYNEKFTLKIGNYLLAMLLDILLGMYVLRFLSNAIADVPPSQILLSNAETLVQSLKSLINWLMGAPAGLKLNYAFNNMLGKFFLYHIHLWWTFLIFMKPMMDLAFNVLLIFGKLGISFQIAIAADLLALVSFHTYCIYVYAARLFNIQLRGLTALFRLFLGKKKNPLRERVDSCQYHPDQLFVGTLLFTILLFLMPTTWVYYTVFTTLRLMFIGLDGLLARLNFYLQALPVYAFFKRLFHSYKACSIIDINLHSHNVQGPTTLIMTMTVAPWKETWEKCIPDTLVCNPPLEWSKILYSIIWGQLLYPL